MNFLIPSRMSYRHYCHKGAMDATWRRWHPRKITQVSEKYYIRARWAESLIGKILDLEKFENR
jgi:hypothetical protein